MGLPEATNHENRSRDRQRRKVGDFQAWLAERFADRLTPPSPRATPAQARGWARARFPAVDLDAQLELQRRRFDHAKLRTRLLGIGAVEDVIGPGHPPERMGELVHAIHASLPPKPEREAALADPARWGEMIRLARSAAATAAARAGIAVREPPAIPAFVPTP